MEAKGLKRIILEITERLTYKFATKYSAIAMDLEIISREIL